MKASINESFVVEVLQTDGAALFNGTCCCCGSCFGHGGLFFHLKRITTIVVRMRTWTASNVGGYRISIVDALLFRETVLRRPLLGALCFST